MASLKKPLAERKFDNIKIGNHNHTDPYFWLRDDNRRDEKIKEYLEKENKWTKHVMEPFKDVKKTIYNEMLSRVQETKSTYPIPKWDNQYKYFTRHIKGKSYPIYCRLNSKTKEEEILLDVNEQAKGYSQCDVVNVSPSPNHKYLCWGIDYDGSETYQIMLKNLENGKTIKLKEMVIPYANFEWGTC